MKIDNFVFNEGIVYVDIFPPLCFYQGRYLVHYLNPRDEGAIKKELERKFEPPEILRRFRSQLLFIDPSLEDLLLETINALLEPPIKKEILEFLAQLPDRLIIDNPQQTRRLIEGYSDDVNILHEIAARIIPPGPERARILERIFRLSSSFPAKGYSQSQEERFCLCKKLLLKYI